MGNPDGFGLKQTGMLLLGSLVLVESCWLEPDAAWPNRVRLLVGGLWISLGILGWGIYPDQWGVAYVLSFGAIGIVILLAGKIKGNLLFSQGNEWLTRTVNSTITRNDSLFYGLTLVLTILFCGALYLWKFNQFHVGTFADDVFYILLSKYIADGESIAWANLWVSEVVGTELWYPLGWPIILAITQWLFNDGIQTLKLLSLLLTIGNTLIIALGWRRLGFGNKWLGLALAALYAFHPLTTGFSGLVMSEPAFLFSILLTLWLTKTMVDTKKPMIFAILLAVSWFFAAYIRYIGFTAIGASILFLLIHKKWGRVVGTGFFLLLILVFVILFTRFELADSIGFLKYSGAFGTDSNTSFFGVQGGLLARTGENIVVYLWTFLGQTIFPITAIFSESITSDSLLLFSGWYNPFGDPNLTFIQWAISLIALSLVLTGFFCTIKDALSFPSYFYVVLYVMVLVFYTFRFNRFFYGIMPFLFYFFFMGALICGARAAKILKDNEMFDMNRRSLPILFTILLVFMNAGTSAMIGGDATILPDFEVVTRWIRDETPKDAIILTDFPHLVYYYAGREPRSLTYEPSQFDFVDREKYVLIAPAYDFTARGQFAPAEQALELLAKLEKAKWAVLVHEDRDLNLKVFRLYSLNDSS